MKLLTFATYRIDAPRHGGQVRLNAIHTVLRSKGWTTQNLAIYTPNAGDAPTSGEWLFPLDAKFSEHLHKTQGRPDVDAADFAISDLDLFDEITAKIDEFGPDVLWLEQPWLWPIVAEYKRIRPNDRAKVVYGSQNVEADLIKNVLDPLSPEAAERIVTKATRIEDQLCMHADAIVGVSKVDLAKFSHYAKPSELFENGVWPRGTTSGFDYWRNECRHLSTLLFVGSAHPPNAAGFHQLLGDNLSFLAPDERIIVLGSVNYLIEKPGFYQVNRGLNLSRLIPVGVQDANGLSTMIELSKGIILPISEGGGTNLKTAEALYNRKRIVATSTAMRGFEEFIEFPGVAIGDTQEQFVAQVKQILVSDGRSPLQYSEREIELLDSLIWTARLKKLPEFLEKLADKSAIGLTSTAASVRSPRENYPRVLTPRMLRPFLGQGWHDFERQGTWTKDEFAILKLEMNAWLGKPINITASVEMFVPKFKTVHLDIYSPTGHRSSHSFNRSTRKQVLNIALTEKDFDDSGVTEIYFESDALFRPNEHSRSPDDRKVGFRFSRLQIEDAQTTQSPAGTHDIPVGRRRFGALLRRTISLRTGTPKI
jgi:hypothetical protein